MLTATADSVRQMVGFTTADYFKGTLSVSVNRQNVTDIMASDRTAPYIDGGTRINFIGDRSITVIEPFRQVVADLS